jgi:hypothetical protein
VQGRLVGLGRGTKASGPFCRILTAFAASAEAQVGHGAGQGSNRKWHLSEEAMTGCEAKTGSGIAADAGCGRRLCRRETLFTAGRGRLASLGVAAFLVLGCVAVGARSTSAAAPEDPVSVVALLNVHFLNDHADLEPTTNAERVRLALIESLFKAKLEASGRYKFVSIPTDAAAKMAAGPEIGACGGCQFDYGKQLGADYAAWMVVQKVSDLILNINVYMVDVAAGKLACVHSVDIRGNTDESWTRGVTYLVKNYLLAGQ